MLAGVWVLVLVPAMAVMDRYHWSEQIFTPTFLREQGSQPLEYTYFRMVYEYLTFCIGVVLLFSKERNRRPGRFDRTRPWGIVASYGVLLLGAIDYAFITALVMIGIAAEFMSMYSRTMPAVTKWFIRLGTGYIYYGPTPSRISDAAVAAFSSIVLLLACVPLFNALRSSGPKVAAAILLAPLVLAAVVQVGQACLFAVNPRASTWPMSSFNDRTFYFNPQLVAESFDDLRTLSLRREVLVEVAKWLLLVAIAVWLSAAQLMAHFKRRKSTSDGGMQ